jgi:hypothetical protein
MPIKPLDRLLFAQGNRCFFCRQPLARSDASIEHLVALANSGPDADENCVACCKALNRLLGSMSLKGKIEVLLNQDGKFKCPNGHQSVAQISDPTKSAASLVQRLSLVVENLKSRPKALPKSIKTLTTTIAALFKPKLTGEEAAAVVQGLQSTGKISVTGSKIAYTL